MISIKRSVSWYVHVPAISWYVLIIGLLSILYALGVDRFLAGSIIQFLFLGFAVAPFLVNRDNKDTLGLIKIRWWVGVLAFLIIAAVSFAYHRLLVGELTLPKLDVRLLYIIVLAPVCEELFFRGYLQPAMGAKTGKWVGLLITALLFAAAHLPKIFILQESSPLALIVLFVLGAVFGIVRNKTGSVYNSMLCHGGWNLVMIFFVVPQY